MSQPRKPPVPAPFGRLAEPIYRMVIERRNRAFDAGQRVARLPVPVVSVGNISVGGTGKTPMVMRIVEWLRAAGQRPAIAMRGYRARPGVLSDEEAEYRERFPDVPIVAQPDRLAGLRPILHREEAGCVVLDDGFQHRFIARDLDVVLVDATRSPFADRCLPAGWLREPVESLRRAGVVVITHAEAAGESEVAQLKSGISALAPDIPVFTARHEWSGVRVAAQLGASDYAAEEPTEWLRGRPVVAACGIGNPTPFIDRVRRAGARLIGVVERRDHHDWAPADAKELRDGLRGHEGAAVVMTEKDWVKFRRLAVPSMIVARPVLRMDLGDAERELSRIVLDAGGGATPRRSPPRQAF